MSFFCGGGGESERVQHPKRSTFVYEGGGDEWKKRVENVLYAQYACRDQSKVEAETKKEATETE